MFSNKSCSAPTNQAMKNFDQKEVAVKMDYYCPICKDKYGDRRVMVQCNICLIWYHCRCVDFNTKLAQSISSQYNCLKCMKENYAGFLTYIDRNENEVKLNDINIVSHIHPDYTKEVVTGTSKLKSVPLTNTVETKSIEIIPSLHGIRNEQSNCWLNAMMQALCSTSLVNILHELFPDRSTDNSTLVHLLNSCFQEMQSRGNAQAPLSLAVFVDVVKAVDMVPQRGRHFDAGEFFQQPVQKILQQTMETIFSLISQRLQVKVLELYRCLSCSSIRGLFSNNPMLMLNLPWLKSVIDIDSILWNWCTTGLYTEPDAPCIACQGSSVMHNFNVLWSLPDILVIYLIRTNVSSIEVNSTPVLITQTLNVRRL